MKQFGLAGYSGAGKTTLIEQLIPRFTARGLRVGSPGTELEFAL